MAGHFTVVGVAEPSDAALAANSADLVANSADEEPACPRAAADAGVLGATVAAEALTQHSMSTVASADSAVSSLKCFLIIVPFSRSLSVDMTRTDIP
jgi:hypothetical protein